jgi:23S rRNA G2069 N7-methylase RlmK/C1962 C5-methylase RlmI
MVEAAGKRLLNLFCYTGGFTVAALKGGAESVVSVDLSQTYLDWLGRNLDLNEVNNHRVRSCHGQHREHRGDVSQFLDEALCEKSKYDIIILDPPVFSNSKSFAGVLDLRRDAAGLLRKCMRLLAPDGKIYFSARGRSWTQVMDTEFNAKALSASLRDKDFEGRKIPPWREIERS